MRGAPLCTVCALLLSKGLLRLEEGLSRIAEEGHPLLIDGHPAETLKCGHAAARDFFQQSVSTPLALIPDSCAPPLALSPRPISASLVQPHGGHLRRARRPGGDQSPLVQVPPALPVLLLRQPREPSGGAAGDDKGRACAHGAENSRIMAPQLSCNCECDNLLSLPVGAWCCS